VVPNTGPAPAGTNVKEGFKRRLFSAGLGYELLEPNLNLTATLLAAERSAQLLYTDGQLINTRKVALRSKSQDLVEVERSRRTRRVCRRHDATCEINRPDLTSAPSESVVLRDMYSFVDGVVSAKPLAGVSATRSTGQP